MKPLLHNLLTAQAERRPDKIAVQMNETSLRYGELEEASNRLARLLNAVGVGRGDRVALAIARSPVALIGALGILKAGGICVPLDVSNPLPRIEKMLRVCTPRLILATGATENLIAGLVRSSESEHLPDVGLLDNGSSVARILFRASDLNACLSSPPQTRGDSHDCAYIMFTSGSTGTPKGVMESHFGISEYVEWGIDNFGIEANDRLAGNAPLHFDPSIFDVFATIRTGATLYQVPSEYHLLPVALARLIRESLLTIWYSVPAILTYLVKFGVIKERDFPALRHVSWSGETLPTPVLMELMTRLPHVAFTNLYGPTEATIHSSHYRVPRCPEKPTDSIPLGAPCAGEELFVLNSHSQLVSEGEIGEIYIGGVGVTAGYYGAPEQTAQAFLAHPFRSGERIYRTGDLARVDSAGFLFYGGRMDSQIKLRGHRIELGEVEAALALLPTVRESAVVAIDGISGDKQICCAYSPQDSSSATPTAIRSELGAILPVHMIPTLFKEYAELPRNNNGKVDRQLLKSEFQVDKVGASTSTDASQVNPTRP